METQLHFWELAPNTYFRLSSRFWGHVLSLKSELKLSWKKLEERAKIDFGNIDDYAKNKQMLPLLNLSYTHFFVLALKT